MSKKTVQGAFNFILLRQKAEEFLCAARLLLDDGQGSQSQYRNSVPLLLGLSIELSLKGFISILGIEEETDLERTHNLRKLFDEAKEHTNFPKVSANQVETILALNEVYASPYIVRYPALGLHQYPDPLDLLDIAARLSTSLDRVARSLDLTDEMVRRRLGMD